MKEPSIEIDSDWHITMATSHRSTSIRQWKGFARNVLGKDISNWRSWSEQLEKFLNDAEESGCKINEAQHLQNAIIMSMRFAKTLPSTNAAKAYAKATFQSSYKTMCELRYNICMFINQYNAFREFKGECFHSIDDVSAMQDLMIPQPLSLNELTAYFDLWLNESESSKRFTTKIPLRIGLGRPISTLATPQLVQALAACAGMVGKEDRRTKAIRSGITIYPDQYPDESAIERLSIARNTRLSLRTGRILRMQEHQSSGLCRNTYRASPERSRPSIQLWEPNAIGWRESFAIYYDDDATDGELEHDEGVPDSNRPTLHRESLIDLLTAQPEVFGESSDDDAVDEDAVDEDADCAFDGACRDYVSLISGISDLY